MIVGGGYALACAAAPFAGAADWPHWMGPERDGHSAESSRFEEGAWPPGKPIWMADVGAGSTSPLVVDGVLYTAGWRGGKDTVVALDAATGNVLWTQSYAAPEYGRHAVGDQAMYRGTSVTPEFDSESGRLYTISCDGDLNCWDTRKKGARVWGLNLYENYRAGQRPQVTDRHNSLRDYGYTTAPLVIGTALLVEVGADAGNLVAFDKTTGRELWKSESKDSAGHSGGLVPMVVEDVPCVAVFTARHLLVARTDAGRAGETVAEFPWVTDFINSIATPAVDGNRVVITSRYNQDAAVCLEISLQGGARQVWRSEGAASGVCSPVTHAGHLHWANKGIHCVDLATGELKWKGGRVSDAGSCVITSDGRMIVWANGGDLILCETAQRSPGAYVQLAEQRGVFGDMAWPHVVLAEGRIYAKTTGGDLACLTLVKAERGGGPARVGK
ncbi:PQQ-like beta-propeller repeat protein [soil metagenome]